MRSLMDKLKTLVCLGVLISTMGARAETGRWVDVHFHLIATSAAEAQNLAKTAQVLMDEEGIRTLVVMPPPQTTTGALDAGDLIQVLRSYGNRFAVVGGGATLNPWIHRNSKMESASNEERAAFRQAAIGMADSGVHGFGEIAVHHLSLTPNHAYESVAADHPLLKVLADVAAERNLIIDLHFDPVLKPTSTPEPLRSFANPSEFVANVEAFERLLAHNRKAKIVWAHAGGLDHLGYFTPELVRELAARHSNLYFSIRPVAPTPNSMMRPNGQINPRWLRIVQELPDRFLFGSDSFLVQAGGKAGAAGRIFAERSKRQREGIARVLQELPPDVAAKVGRENAMKLYGLE